MYSHMHSVHYTVSFSLTNRLPIEFQKGGMDITQNPYPLS